MQQLRRFLPHMHAFLTPIGLPFHVYVIEQSDDGRLFNRGALLNIGFRCAREAGHFSNYVMHDVDLLPGEDLQGEYAALPSQPIHIAHCWSRYSSVKNYFGGIVSFSAATYEAMNGFPNNYWCALMPVPAVRAPRLRLTTRRGRGWGGEDDELYMRLGYVGGVIWRPEGGSVVDLEGLEMDQKLRKLRALRRKNPVQWELMAAAPHTWRDNGLTSLGHKVLRERKVELPDCPAMEDHHTIVTVQLPDFAAAARDWGVSRPSHR